jgi:hypothetical protein
MKNKKQDELDRRKSVSVAPRCRRNHPISKTNPFADISRGVVFGAAHHWDKGTEIWKRMNQITDTNNVQIRLLTSGKPETPWFKVDLYNLDKQSFTNLNSAPVNF